MKRDKFFRSRDGVASTYRIHCLCGQFLFTYQKDGRGNLKRCYLNRIMDTEWSKLYKKCKTTAEIPGLICSKCNEVIGTPMFHREGRLAFKLRLGKWKKGKK